MKTLWIEDQDLYDGSQLKSLFAYLEHGVLGDSIVSWRGPCDVHFDHMVDGEDLLAQNLIYSTDMLHFIVEVFEKPLFVGVCLQRILSSLAMAEIQKHLKKTDVTFDVERRGDDIFIDDRKFNISIATSSPASVLLHYGVNISSQGTPVPTSCLNEFSIDPVEFASDLMQRFASEFESIQRAVCKVRWVN